MELLRWMRQERGRPGRLAGTVGRSITYLWMLAKGNKGAAPDTAAAISAATGGEVTVAEILYPGGLPTGARLAPAPEPPEVPAQGEGSGREVA